MQDTRYKCTADKAPKTDDCHTRAKFALQKKIEHNMKCPVCGATELVHDTRDLPYTYKGESTLIANVAGDFCPACAESILDAKESARVMAEMTAFTKQVNASIVDPQFIANVRKKLNLDQREAAELFGGGTNAFSRYETGKTKPHLALVKLFKLLDKHPELIDEVRACNITQPFGSNP